MLRHWVYRESKREEAALLVKHLGLSPVTAQLLANRGQQTPEQARRFLRPVLTALQDPLEVASVRRGSEVLAEAVREGRKITVYGDYDADGITATVVLVKCLRCAGADPNWYVPLRESEGYGLHSDVIRRLAGDGTEVLVTVDCGITAIEQAQLARELGVTLIVTDHHEPLAEQPEAAAVIDPKLPESGFACQQLCGAGVAFKLAWALARQLTGAEKVDDHFREFLVSAVSLVALGTVADVVPLQNENRVFAYYGVRSLSECEDAGICALIDVAGLSGRRLSTYDIGFKLAPRINAAGRMDDAGVAIDLLLKDNYEEALSLARQLDSHNEARQRVQRLMVEEATRMVESSWDVEADPFIVLSSDQWRRGVVGIVASKIADRFCRPVVVFAIEDGIAHGSGRSVGSFDLYRTLKDCDPHPEDPEQRLFQKLGGHEKAAGMALGVDRIEEFRQRVNEIARERLTPQDMLCRLNVDLDVRLQELSPRVLQEIKQLAPFGESNPRPVLASRGVHLVGNPTIIGSQQRHLSFLVRQDDTSFRVIAFDGRELLEDLREHGESLDLAYEPRINDWSGVPEVELRLKDLKWSREVSHALDGDAE